MRWAYAKSLGAAPGDGGHSSEKLRQEELNQRLVSSSGTENPFRIWRELGESMTKNVTVHPLQQEHPGNG